MINPLHRNLKRALPAAGLLLGAAAALHANFPIASQQMAESFAFDGTGYLVGLVDYSASPRTVGARLLPASGTPVGSFITTARSGIAANVAYDGANHLLVWEDDGLGTLDETTGWRVYGQFISPVGALVGSPFAITTAGIWLDGLRTLEFGGGAYLMTYTRLINPALGGESENRYVAGRIIQPDGTLGDELRISAGHGRAASVATDGANFLVIWCEDVNDTEIRGRLVAGDGSLGAEFSVNSSSAPSDNPHAVIFNGQHYLVVWNDEVGGMGSQEWDIRGQLVSGIGAPVGPVININSDSGRQIPTTVAFDGVRHLVCWVDMQDFMDWQMYGQFVNTDGSLDGGKFAISTAAGNQMGGVGFANGKYLALINNGVAFDMEGQIAGVVSSEGSFLDGTTLPPQLHIRVQSSVDLSTWDDVPVTPSMIAPDGQLVLPAGGDGSFYRLEVTGAN